MPIHLTDAIAATDSFFETKNKDAVALYAKIAEKHQINIDLKDRPSEKENKKALVEALLKEKEYYKAVALYVTLGGSNEEMDRRKDILMHTFLSAYAAKGHDERPIRLALKTPLIKVNNKERRIYLANIQEFLPASAARLSCFNSFSKWCFELKEKGDKSNRDYIRFDWANIIAEAIKPPKQTEQE